MSVGNWTGWGSHTAVQPKQKIWATDAFVAEFCDPFAEDMTLTNDASEINHRFAQCLDYLCKRMKDAASPFSADVRQKCTERLSKLHAAVVASEELYRKLQGYLQWKMQYYLSKLMDIINKQILSLEAEGDVIILPLLIPGVGATGTSMVVEFATVDHVRVTVINASNDTEYHPRTCDPQNPTKLKQIVALTLSLVPKAKLMSEAWWSLVILSKNPLGASDKHFYTHFCSWLTDRPHESQIADFFDEAVYATPMHSTKSGTWKSLIHCLKHILRRCGLPKEEVKFVRFHVKQHMLNVVQDDLTSVKGIKHATKVIIHQACKSAAMSIARNEALFEKQALADARHFLERLLNTVNSMKCEDVTDSFAPPTLELDGGWDRHQQPDSFPLFECLRRLESVDQFAGAIIEQARTVPTNLLRVPAAVATLEEAILALNEAVMVVTRLTMQPGVGKNHAHLVATLLVDLSVRVLPSPLSAKRRAEEKRQCIWSDTPLRYGQQLHILKRLTEVMEYMLRALFCMVNQRETDAYRVLAMANLVAIADAVVRREAEDKPSLFSLHYSGAYQTHRRAAGVQTGHACGFAITLGKLAEQSASFVFVQPEMLTVRCAVLDYFDDTRSAVPNSNMIFTWEHGLGLEDPGSLKLLRQIAGSEAYLAQVLPHKLLEDAVEGCFTNLMRYYPDARYFRNMVVMFRMLLSGTSIPTNEYLSNWMAESIRFEDNGQGGFNVYSFDGLTLRVEPQLRFPSLARPANYTKPHEVHTEDDILHVKSLAAFTTVMGQRDEELLLSYLTVPYLRIPLVLRFFATEDRISCLKQESIQELLQSVLFEGGTFLPNVLSGKCPELVPSEKPELVACPLGLLLNELMHYPAGVLDPMVRLVELASELDSGTVFNDTTTSVILCLVRIVARVHSYILFAEDIVERQLNDEKNGKDIGRSKTASLFRDLTCTEATLSNLHAAYHTIQRLIEDSLLPMLDTWLNEVLGFATTALKTEDIDRATNKASRLHMHIILLLRNMRESGYTEKSIALLLSSFTFLTTRYTWTTQPAMELELYTVIQRHRRGIVRFLSTLQPSGLCSILDAVVRITTSASSRDAGQKGNWGLVAGADCVGRFARLDDELMKRQGREKGVAELLVSMQSCLDVRQIPQGMVTVAEGLQDVELNLHTLSLTFKNAHLRAIPSEVANDPSVYAVFAPIVAGRQKLMESMQCAVVEDSINRLWLRLVGQDHDVQFWKTPDPRQAIPSDTMMRFYPDDLADTEQWVIELFEPVRQAYFERSFWDPPVFCLIQETKLTHANSVATITAIDSQSGRKLKEVYVFRDFRTVHVYDIFSHGRRFYRRLVFASDNRYCLNQLHPSTERRERPWPTWARHLAGDADPDSSTETPQTCVIMRHASHPSNLSKSTETFIPGYFLHGLIPSCLIDTHQFWQDEDDNIRGYPIEDYTQVLQQPQSENNEKDDHILWIHWRETQFDPLAIRNTCAKVYRFARAKEAPKSSEEAVLRSTKQVLLTDEVEGELEMTRAQSKGDLADEERNADLEAGMFRQSSVAAVVTNKNDAATIEDNNLLLLNLMYARAGTPLHSLAKVFARIELLSHVLVWTTKTDYNADDGELFTIDLIQLPRLKLSFMARLGPDKQYRIYSLDHSQLHITNIRPALVNALLEGVPHALLLADSNNSISILVPSLNLTRPAIALSPFSTELVLNRADELWYRKLDTRYYLFPVHVSLSFLFTPTLSSALYLMVLRFLNRNYQEVFRLAGSIGTDMELTPEEAQIFAKVTTVIDDHPDANACRAKISLLVADSPVSLAWYVPEAVATFLSKLNHVSVNCRLHATEERRLLYVACMIERKMEIISAFCKAREESFTLVMNRLADRTIQLSAAQSREIKKFYADLGNELREKLDVRVMQEDMNRLLTMYTQHRKEPMLPFFRCTLFNRQIIIEAEANRAPGDESAYDLTLAVPAMGEDLKWNFYSDFKPVSVKPPGSVPQQRNAEGRAVTCSPIFDYYYCSSQTRAAKSCKCRNCNETCGPQNGCPCVSCEKFNRETGDNIRVLPETLEASRSLRSLSFYEAFMWATEVFNRFSHWKPDPENRFLEKTPACSLREANNALLRYYELLTGTSKMKICSGDSGRDFAQLLFHFSRDARTPAAPLGHLGQFIVQSSADVVSKLAKYNRNSKQKPEQRAVGIYNSILSVAGQYPVDRSEYLNNLPKRLGATEVVVNAKPRPSTRDVGTPLHATTILPIPLNTDCNVRTLSIPDTSALRITENETQNLAVTDALLQELAGMPLKAAVDDGVVSLMTRADQNMPPISDVLPFNLTTHEHASKTVARDMLQRLEQDMADFASKENHALVPKITALATAGDLRNHIITGKTTKELLAVRAILNRLHQQLKVLREADQNYLAHSVPVIVRTVNHIDNDESRRDTQLLLLRRFADKECSFTIDYLIASLCSTTAFSEWSNLNPFLTPATCEALANAIVVTMLRANRIGHINRACEITKDLLQMLDKADKFPEYLDPVSLGSFREAMVASVLQKADSLAMQLNTSRCYLDPKTLQFDPRFLLFEFTWNLVLRGRQQELIMEMYESVTQRRSLVKQMIMGAGKTTVVGPLLAIMLADGNDLVVQVVPPALLDFTRAVLRTTFSSVLQKQVFTFICDRSSEVDSEILSKFLHAKTSRGVVVTTPSSIKSVFLKYVERLDKLADPDRAGRTVNDEKEAKDLLKVLTMLRQSVLIMDEVDMLLHPLKSELNFPVGAKKNIDFTPTRWKLPIHIIDAIFYFHTHRVTTIMKDNPGTHEILQRFKVKVKEGVKANAIQEMPHITLLNTEFYDKELKPILAEWTNLFIKAQHFVGLSDEEAIKYIQRRPLITEQPELVAKISALEEDHVKILNLAFEWLNCFLPHCLQKIDRVAFGIMNEEDMRRARLDHPHMPQSRYVTAIPFIGKDLPSQSSEFAHPDVVIGLTILAYRYEGIRQMDFSTIMRELHAAVEKEVGRFSQRRTNIMFTKWVGASGGRIITTYNYEAKKKDRMIAASSRDDGIGMQPSESILFDENGNVFDDRIVDVLPLKLMKQANKSEMDKLFKLFRRTAEVIHWYLCESIFPNFMRHQNLKLSASGQELGGDLVFERRIGFSGTPSDLLPVELGHCSYERGTDGELIHTLTNPEVMTYQVVEAGWSVRGLLDLVANASPPFHALIDTGALITGMSNLQVAQYLLKNGLPQMEGVVFLDEYDRKMIFVRATGRVLKLAECGIPKVKRFAFYDQVHTTGMDIEHTPNAVAVQTLGKDMTFRDLSQGAYRMRGIGQGQTVHLLVIPEVYDLILRSLRHIRSTDKDRDDLLPFEKRKPSKVLTDITAWLLVNSIRTEHTQHNQLCLQSCANVWRKSAFKVLNEHIDEFKVDAQPSATALGALEVFREPVHFNIANNVPQPRLFSECVKQYVAGAEHLITTPEGRRIIDGIVEQTVREDELENPVVDVQMVQEQEEEKETEQEQEKEQEIELEKYLDLAYSRDEETSFAWRLDSLRSGPDGCPQFYKLSDFHLYKRRPLQFPDSVYLSKNFFNKKWSGHRRIKNVIVTLEWIPSAKELVVRERADADYGAMEVEGSKNALQRTLSLVGEHQHGFSQEFVRDLLTTALNLDGNDAEISEAEWAQSLQSLTTMETSRFYDVLAGNMLRSEEEGRYFVCVSLDEAETLRRVIHLKSTQATLFPGSDASIGLNIVPSNFATLDASVGYVVPQNRFMHLRNYQCLRFFDCDLHYTESEFGLLLRSVHTNAEKMRQAYFQQVMSCRRRARQRWERTPIALLFVMRDAFSLFHQRSIGLCMRRWIESQDLSLGDAYMAFNSSHSGVLTPDEVWGAARWCGFENLTVEEILDFIDVADSSREGSIQYPDFLSVLTGNREHDEDTTAVAGPAADDAQGKKLPTIEPYGAEQLRAARAVRQRKQREQEADANREMESENQRVMDEIEAEQISEELLTVQSANNPLLDSHSLTFTFRTPVGEPPKLIVPSGGKAIHGVSDEYMSQVEGVPHTQLAMEGGCTLRLPLKILKRVIKRPSLHHEPAKVLDTFTISVEFVLPQVDAAKQPANNLFGIPQQEENPNGLLTALKRVSAPLTFASWHLPMFRFAGFTASNMPAFEVDIFGARAIRDTTDASGTAALQQDVSGLFGSSGAQRAPKMSAKAGGGGGLFQQLQQQQQQARGGSASQQNAPIHVFPEPKPCSDPSEALGQIEPNAFVVADGEKTNNSVEGVAYEWMHIVSPYAGWVVREKNGNPLWDRLSTSIKLDKKGKLVVEQLPVPHNAVEITSKFEDPVVDADEEEGDSKKKKKKNEDDEENHQSDFVEMNAELMQLLEALRKAKRLRSGDKVTRNPECWEKGDEDGGEGKVGKVLRVDNDAVHVQWPGGNKGQYQWGQQGRFELIKVADADSDDEGEEREVLNDDRWVVELRKGGQKCGNCNAQKLDIGNWFRCNHCDSYHLCKKCFRGGQHQEHDFTDMAALAQGQQSEIGPGALVRIKLSVTNPKFGWESSFAGATGVVLDVDAEDCSVTVEMDHDKSEFRADLTEIEAIKEEKSAAAESGIKKYPYLLAVIGELAAVNLQTATETVATAYHQAVADLKKNHSYLAESVLAAKAANTPKFAVGEKVMVNYYKSGTWYPVMIRSVDLDTRVYQLYGDCTGHLSSIEESDIKPLPAKEGDTVRIRRNKNAPTAFYVPNFAELKRLNGIITSINAYSGDRLATVIQFENGTSSQLMVEDVEVVGNGKWTLHKYCDDGTESSVVLPTSSNIVVERAFSDGQQYLTTFIRDDLYELDLASNEVKRASKRFGRLTRDPPEPFAKGEDKIEFDDGVVHLLSVSVQNGKISALCDGRQLDVQFTGLLLAIKDDKDREAAQATALRFPFVHSPLYMMGCGVQDSVLQAHSLFGGNTAPSKFRREVNWVRLDWATPRPAAATTDAAEQQQEEPDNDMCTQAGLSAWHAAINKAYSWTCRECRRENPRTAEVCGECKVPRVEKKAKGRDSDSKFRCALPRSREAATVRAKLQGKLRSQVQKELDVLEEAAAQQQKEKGKKSTGV